MYLPICLSVFSFQDDNLRKFQLIFTKLGLHIDILEFWFGLLMGNFCPFLSYVLDTFVFSFLDDNLSTYQRIITKRGMCCDIADIWFGVVNGHISSIFDSYLPADSGRGYYHFSYI